MEWNGLEWSGTAESYLVRKICCTAVAEYNASTTALGHRAYYFYINQHQQTIRIVRR